MSKFNVGEIIEGTVINIRPFGAIMLFDDGTKGLLHISEIANSFIKNIYRYLLIGKTYQVKVIDIADDGFLKVSMSKISQEEKEQYRSSNTKRTPVSEDCIDFEALKNKIEEWTKEEN